MKKNCDFGEGCNCDVMGDGNSPADHSHVSHATPMQTKMKEIQNDPRYLTETAPDIDKVRFRRTAAMRRDKDVRPL